MSFLKSLFRRATPEAPVTPELDEAVARKLAAEGKDPGTVASRAAEPREVPPRPDLGAFKGAVRFVMTLDGLGEVKAVAMDGAPFEHVQALEAWAYAWKFRPAILDGQPHACRMVYEVSWS
ncbi:MAG TPA: hypothetical protein VJ570_01490 [Holophagaceae bacterium]|nr:hypothetical protein [Holophagaceae bacterium]